MYVSTYLIMFKSDFDRGIKYCHRGRNRKRENRAINFFFIITIIVVVWVNSIIIIIVIDSIIITSIIKTKLKEKNINYTRIVQRATIR